MVERIAFYMDEHVPRAVTEGLRRRGLEALTAGEAGNLEADDEHHLTFAAGQGRVLVTEDADFLRLHAAGHQHRGIVYAPQGTSIGRIVRGLALIHDVLGPEDMTDHVEFI